MKHADYQGLVLEIKAEGGLYLQHLGEFPGELIFQQAPKGKTMCLSCLVSLIVCKMRLQLCMCVYVGGGSILKGVRQI